jgi:membrane-bound ClpP family serine protease
MIILGIILLVIGLLVGKLAVLVTIGIVLIVIGLILAIPMRAATSTSCWTTAPPAPATCSRDAH